MIDYTPKKQKVEFTGFSKKYGAPRSVKPLVTELGYNPRTTVKIPSMVTIGGSTARKEVLKYTGSDMIGISIIHKSCLQPVFNTDAAKDAANMRR